MERQTITGSLSTSGRLSGALSVGGGTTDYNELENKPSINGIELSGNMNLWPPKNFSETEQNTRVKWIDGKDIYCNVLKTYDTYQSNTAIFNVGDINVLKISGIVNIGSAELPADYFCVGSHSYFISTFYDIATKTIHCVNFGWSISEYNIIIYYTKN